MRSGFFGSGPVLLVGARGQLGAELARALDTRGVDFWPADREGRDGALRVDLAQAELAARTVISRRPSVVLNAAAYTAVDRAESERELAMSVNARGPAALARACREVDALLVHFSTDYVFDGRAERAYAERDPVSPVNHYGVTKARGEELVRAGAGAHLIFRTSWLYTPGGRNFVTTMLRLFAGDRPVRVVDDQWGCPTWARPLAREVVELIARTERERLRASSGLYHLCGSGVSTWFEFARAIHEQADPPARAPLESIDTATFGAPAARPMRAVLACERSREVLGLCLDDWRVQLAAAMPEFNALARDGR